MQRNCCGLDLWCVTICGYGEDVICIYRSNPVRDSYPVLFQISSHRSSRRMSRTREYPPHFSPFEGVKSEDSIQLIDTTLPTLSPNAIVTLENNNITQSSASASHTSKP